MLPRTSQSRSRTIAALGANNLQIGILAAVPFLAQPLQIPSILLVEKLKKRKLIAFTTWLVAQLLWIPVALIPVFMDVPSAGAISILLVLGLGAAFFVEYWKGQASPDSQALGYTFPLLIGAATLGVATPVCFVVFDKSQSNCLP